MFEKHYWPKIEKTIDIKNWPYLFDAASPLQWRLKLSADARVGKKIATLGEKKKRNKTKRSALALRADHRGTNFAGGCAQRGARPATWSRPVGNRFLGFGREPSFKWPDVDVSDARTAASSKASKVYSSSVGPETRENNRER